MSVSAEAVHRLRMCSSAADATVRVYHLLHLPSTYFYGTLVAELDTCPTLVSLQAESLEFAIATETARVIAFGTVCRNLGGVRAHDGSAGSPQHEEDRSSCGGQPTTAAVLQDDEETRHRAEQVQAAATQKIVSDSVLLRKLRLGSILSLASPISSPAVRRGGAGLCYSSMLAALRLPCDASDSVRILEDLLLELLACECIVGRLDPLNRVLRDIEKVEARDIPTAKSQRAVTKSALQDLARVLREWQVEHVRPQRELAEQRIAHHHVLCNRDAEVKKTFEAEFASAVDKMIMKKTVSSWRS